MNVMFGFQVVIDLMLLEILYLVVNAFEAHQIAQKDLKTPDCKA